MHRKTKKVARRKTRRGGFYGASGPIAPGAMEWSRGSEMGDWAISNRGANAQYGRGRKHKKAGRKTRRKTRKGGGSFGSIFAGYSGHGSRGIADYDEGTHKPGQAALGDFNNKGAGPGNFSSFVKAH